MKKLFVSMVLLSVTVHARDIPKEWSDYHKGDVQIEELECSELPCNVIFYIDKDNIQRSCQIDITSSNWMKKHSVKVCIERLKKLAVN